MWSVSATAQQHSAGAGQPPKHAPATALWVGDSPACFGGSVPGARHSLQADQLCGSCRVHLNLQLAAGGTARPAAKAPAAAQNTQPGSSCFLGNGSAESTGCASTASQPQGRPVQPASQGRPASQPASQPASDGTSRQCCLLLLSMHTAQHLGGRPQQLTAAQCMKHSGRCKQRCVHRGAGAGQQVGTTAAAAAASRRAAAPCPRRPAPPPALRVEGPRGEYPRAELVAPGRHS